MTDNLPEIWCKLVPGALPLSQNGPQASNHKSIPVFKYEALSYNWGQDAPSIPLTIVTHDKRNALRISQKKFWVRPNLHAAIAELRSPNKVRKYFPKFVRFRQLKQEVTLWVDAICINQEDKVEKKTQVSRMNEIYSKAHSVCVWLGVGYGAESNKETFDFIVDMLNLRRLDKLIVSEAHSKQ